MSIKNQGSNWIRRDKRLALYLRDGMNCTYCGTSFDEMCRTLTLDHVTPTELGGSNKATNLVTACASCNSAKAHLPLQTWLAGLRDAGVDTDGIAERVRRRTRRSITKLRKQAKALLAFSADNV